MVLVHKDIKDQSSEFKVQKQPVHMRIEYTIKVASLMRKTTIQQLVLGKLGIHLENQKQSFIYISHEYLDIYQI